MLVFRAVATNGTNLGGLKQQRCILSCSGSRKSKIKVSTGPCSCRNLWESFLTLSNFRWPQAFLSLGLSRLLSRVRLFVTPWTVAHQVPLPMVFCWKEYWSTLPCPPQRDLPGSGLKPSFPAVSCIAGGFFTTEPPGKPLRKPQRTPSGHTTFEKKESDWKLNQRRMNLSQRWRNRVLMVSSYLT